MELRDLAGHGVAIATSEEARERDARAIAYGIPSRSLMANAGKAASERIVHHFRDQLSSGVCIYTGAGNNGGDGWVVAEELAKREVPVRVVEVLEAKSEDALSARAAARQLTFRSFAGRPGVIVDALLGTGSRGAPTGAIADAVTEINGFRSEGSVVVALDIPTGLDATSGETSNPVDADLTLSFGTIKRGHLVSRRVCGVIEVLDIKLGKYGSPGNEDIALADNDWVFQKLPDIPPDAHKGTRKRLAIVAGDVGMGGAAILCARAALRSGVGLVQLVVAAENRAAVHAAVPAALVATHEEVLNDAKAVLGAPDAFVIGPGLQPGKAIELVSAVEGVEGPFVLDAGALSLPVNELRSLCTERPVVLTPHPAEMGRLVGASTQDILARRFDVGQELARDTGAVVLLKGTPTVVSDRSRRMATATGNAALATGGSGDILSGMIGTLLAQSGSAFEAAVCAAWVHGRAAEICGSGRGVTLDDVLYAMPAACKVNTYSRPAAVLASLPSLR